MNTLVLTTSTGLIGVGATRGQELVAVETNHNERRHAEDLAPAIARVCSQAGWPVSAAEAIVVDIGPGRFTGLRVGVTTARGLASVCGARIAGVCSLAAVAAAVRATEGPVAVHAVIDARRGEVFHQHFAADGKPLSEPVVAGPDQTARWIANGIAAGDGAVRYAEELASATVLAADPEPSALWRLASDRFEAPPGPLPLYLRGADAKVGKWTLRPGLAQGGGS